MRVNFRDIDSNVGWTIVWDEDRRIRAQATLHGLPSGSPFPLNFEKLLDMLINCGLHVLTYPNAALLDHLKYQPLVTEAFACKVWDSRFRLDKIFKFSDWEEHPNWAILRRDKTMKKYVDLEADLWVATFKMLERMSSLSALTCHTLTAFWLLIEEQSWLSFQLRKDEKSATEIFHELQHEHGAIRSPDRGHAFSQQDSPIAFRVFTAAQKLVDQNQSFRKEYYNPVLDARRALIKQMNADELVTVDRDGHTSTQGRRKKRTSRGASSSRKK